MASTLRGGLSFGLSGFTFWSHDIGGFMGKTTEDLYARWLPFGMLTSHSRSHGFPPREPWEFGEAFTNAFRRAVEMRYRLMPYIYAQAKDSSARGLPMLRALFVEFPEDAGSWSVEDEYLFGSDILVAPLLETGTKGRDVYLPPGQLDRLPDRPAVRRGLAPHRGRPRSRSSCWCARGRPFRTSPSRSRPPSWTGRSSTSKCSRPPRRRQPDSSRCRTANCCH